MEKKLLELEKNGTKSFLINWGDKFAMGKTFLNSKKIIGRNMHSNRRKKEHGTKKLFPLNPRIISRIY